MSDPTSTVTIKTTTEHPASTRKGAVCSPRFHPTGLRRGRQHADSGRAGHGAGRSGELRVPVPDQAGEPVAGLFELADEVAGELSSPVARRARRDPGQMKAPGPDPGDERYIQAPGPRSGMTAVPSAGPGRARQARPARPRTSAAPEPPGAAPRPRAAAPVTPRPWTRTTAPAARTTTPRSPAAGKPASRTRALIMAVSKSQVKPAAEFSTSTVIGDVVAGLDQVRSGHRELTHRCLLVFGASP